MSRCFWVRRDGTDTQGRQRRAGMSQHRSGARLAPAGAATGEATGKLSPTGSMSAPTAAAVVRAGVDMGLRIGLPPWAGRSYGRERFGRGQRAEP